MNLLQAFGGSRLKFDGHHSRNWWEQRDDGVTEEHWAAYWGNRDAPARHAIADAVAALRPASVLEVGCHAGSNLWAIARAAHIDRIVGTELSPRLLQLTQKRLAEELGRRDVEIRHAAADDLPFARAQFDVVVTSVCLCCIGPERIKRSLREISRVAGRWLVLAEPLERDKRFATANGRPDPYPNTTYWVRDYATMLQKQWRVISVRVLPKEHHIGHLDSVMVLERIKPKSR